MAVEIDMHALKQLPEQLRFELQKSLYPLGALGPEDNEAAKRLNYILGEIIAYGNRRMTEGQAAAERHQQGFTEGQLHTAYSLGYERGWVVRGAEEHLAQAKENGFQESRNLVDRIRPAEKKSQTVEEFEAKMRAEQRR